MHGNSTEQDSKAITALTVTASLKTRPSAKHTVTCGIKTQDEQ